MALADDPRYVAAAIETERAQLIQTQAQAIRTLIDTNKFTRNSVVHAVTSSDLSLLESSSKPPSGKITVA